MILYSMSFARIKNRYNKYNRFGENISHNKI